MLKMELRAKHRSLAGCFAGKPNSLKSNFSLKIKILVVNRIFHDKSIFWSKIELFAKYRNFARKPNFSSIVDGSLKINILVENRMFGRKSNF